MARNGTLAITGILLVGLIVGVLFWQPSLAGGSGGSEVASNCISPNFGTGEDSAGGFLCAQVQLSDLGGSTACPSHANQEYAISLSSGGFVCGTPVDNITNINGVGFVGKVTLINSTSIGIQFGSGSNANKLIFRINPASCTSPQFVTGVNNNPEITCAQVLLSDLGGLPISCPNGQYAYSLATSGFTCSQDAFTFFTSNTKSCATTTSNVVMAGFKLNYTTQGVNYNHNVVFALTFQLTEPATSAVTFTYVVAYGTGTAPACLAAQAGTQVGNQYVYKTTTSSEGITSKELVGGIDGLTASTTYWFDLVIKASTTTAWTVSKPDFTLIET